MSNPAKDTDEAILAVLRLNPDGLTYDGLTSRIPFTAIDGRLFELLKAGMVHCTNKVFWLKRAKTLTLVR